MLGDKRGSAAEKAARAGSGVCEGVLSKGYVQELRWSHGANYRLKRSEEEIRDHQIRLSGRPTGGITALA